MATANDTKNSFIYNDNWFGSAMAFLENLENQLFQEELPLRVNTLKVLEEEVCDDCCCKTTVVNDLLQSQTSFEE